MLTRFFIKILIWFVLRLRMATHIAMQHNAIILYRELVLPTNLSDCKIQMRLSAQDSHKHSDHLVPVAIGWGYLECRNSSGIRFWE